jgi:hypothetical protein
VADVRPPKPLVQVDRPPGDLEAVLHVVEHLPLRGEMLARPVERPAGGAAVKLR